MAASSSKRPPDTSAYSNKKAKFDTRNPSRLAQREGSDEDEDSILDLDQIGKGGLRSKRNAVRLEGYDSDSENENFDNRAAAKAVAKAEAERKGKAKATSLDDEDADMFGELEDDIKDGDDDEDLANSGKKRKGVRFLDEQDIQGQVATSRSGGHVSSDFSTGSRAQGAHREESSDSEDEEEEEYDEELGAGSKKKHAPKLDAFNMKDEQEEGRFDESGNFVRNAADPFALHDAWLEDASKGDIKRARAAQLQREQAVREKDEKEDTVPTHELLATVIKYLEPGETILEALQRFGQGKKTKQKPKWKKNSSKAMDVDEPAQEIDEKEHARRRAVEAITGAADILASRIETDDIFDEERGALMRLYKNDTGDEWKDVESQPSDQAKQWEYRWEDARDGGDVHGPYDGPTMVAWQEAGYFGEGVVFRAVGSEEWKPSVGFI